MDTFKGNGTHGASISKVGRKCELDTLFLVHPVNNISGRWI